jgi:hypothetical protein
MKRPNHALQRAQLCKPRVSCAGSLSLGRQPRIAIMSSPKMIKAIGYALIWVILSSTGCSPAGSKSPAVFTSPDGRVSVTAPAGWEKHTFKSKLGKIGIANMPRKGFGEVIIESKSDLKDGLTLSRYAEIVMKKTAERTGATGDIENRTVSEPTSLTINGYPAMRYEIKATVQDSKFVYARTFVETPDFFVQVLLWTIPSHLSENQADFDSIANSLNQMN